MQKFCKSLIYILIINLYAIQVFAQAGLVFQNGFEKQFGQTGTHTLAMPYQEPTELATLYYPTDASAVNKVPVVFFIPGFGGIDPNQYDTLLRFVASHGYAAIFAQDNNKFDFSSADMIVDFIAMVTDKAALLDTTRIGVIGHSSGGGYAFNILYKLSDVQGWGANGRFLMVFEPWFAFDMMQSDMQSLPANSNVIIQQYGIGGFNAANSTDMRIPLTEYYLLESITNNKKDYQVHEMADHHYPTDDIQSGVANKQIILAPLDALMQYTFIDSNNQLAHDSALALGNDDPYANGNGIQAVFPRGDVRIQFPCNGYNFTNHNIDFCDIKGYPNASKLTAIPTNNATLQPGLLSPSTDVEFGTTISRLTQRVNQNDTPTVDGNGNRVPRGNHQPYPKTQAWNADMSMIRMNYRIYDANTFAEIPLSTPSGNYPLTTNTDSLSDLYHINGALNEKKWSTVDPNVFYGVYLSGSNGQFWKGTIDRAAQTITYAGGLIHEFAGNYEKFSLGKFEGNISYDDNHVVFAARKTGANYLTAIVYDKSTNTSISKDFDGNNGNALIQWPDFGQVFDWISVSPLATHILLSSGGVVYQYDMVLNYIGQLATSAGHGDMGIAQNGEEVYVQYEYGVDAGVWAYRLQKFANGDLLNVYRHQLLPDKYNGGHISCRNYQRPGWCYLSNKKEGYREVYALRINFADMSKHVVNRFAQTHTHSIDVAGNTMNSLGNVSPDGRRVLFFSDWEDATLSYYDRDTYQAKKPN